MQDLNGLGVLGVPRVGLEIVLRDICRVRYPSLDELENGGQLGDTRDLRGREHVLDSQEHGARTGR